MIAALLLMLAAAPARPAVHDVTGKVFKTTAIRKAAALRSEMTIVVIRPAIPQPEPFSFTVRDTRSPRP